MPLHTRQAVLADLDVLAPLFDRFRQSQRQPSDEAAARAYLHQRFQHGQSVVFLAELDGAAVGFTQLYPMFSSVGLARAYVLNDLFVAEAGRRRGVATALLAAAEHYAQAMGASRLSLNVERDNAEGRALYDARGWQADGHYLPYHRFFDLAGAPTPAAAGPGEGEGEGEGEGGGGGGGEVNDDLQWSTEDAPAPADLQALADAVRDFGRRQAAAGEARPIACLLRQQGRLVGGAAGRTEYRRLFVEHLWVAEPLRHAGHATALLARLQAAARDRGAEDALIETLLDDTAAFYQRRGYRTLVTVPRWVGPFTRHVLVKPLADVASA